MIIIAAEASGAIRNGLDTGLKALGINPGDPAAQAPADVTKALQKDADSAINAADKILK
jgi:hypothetical protein